MVKKVEKQATKEELEREFLTAAAEVFEADIAWKSADERAAIANWNLGNVGNKVRPLFEHGTWMEFLKAHTIPQRTVNRATEIAHLPLRDVKKWGVTKCEWIVRQCKEPVTRTEVNHYAKAYDDMLAKKREDTKAKREKAKVAEKALKEAIQAGSEKPSTAARKGKGGRRNPKATGNKAGKKNESTPPSGTDGGRMAVTPPESTTNAALPQLTASPTPNGQQPALTKDEMAHLTAFRDAIGSWDRAAWVLAEGRRISEGVAQ